MLSAVCQSSLVSSPRALSFFSSKSGDAEVEDVYGKSLTEKRLEETDFLKSILERTQQCAYASPLALLAVLNSLL
jgi:hypothetical protein